MLCFDVVFYIISFGFFSADLTFENSFSFMISKFFVCFLHHRPYRVVRILENSREIRGIFNVVFFRLVYLLCIFLDLVHRWNGFRIVKLKFMTLEWVSSSEDIVTMITWKQMASKCFASMWFSSDEMRLLFHIPCTWKIREIRFLSLASCFSPSETSPFLQDPPDLKSNFLEQHCFPFLNCLFLLCFDNFLRCCSCAF